MAAQPSINYRIADHMRALSPALTDLAARDYVATPWYTPGSLNGFHSYLYRDPGDGIPVRMPLRQNVAEEMASLFPSDGAADERIIQGAQPQVLDLLHREYGRLAPQLPAADRTRLELHQSMIADLNRRLSTVAALGCRAPVLGAGPGEGTLAAMDFNYDSFSDLMAMAFACDLTRVATLVVEWGIDPTFWGGAPGDYHHTYAHPADPHWAWRVGHEYDEHVAAVAVQSRRMTWTLERAAHLADRLDAIPEGDGTVLDNTAIVVMNEIAHGGHGHDQWPVVILGGLGGSFRTGVYLRYPQNNPSPWMHGYGRQFAGHPHTQLLTSLCQGVGMDVADMGLRSIEGRVMVGPYEGRRRMIDLSGPLERLMA
jgi:hypothetical protein